MKIILENNAESYYREVANVAAQAPLLYKDPHKKLRDVPRSITVELILLLAVVLLNGTLAIMWGPETIQIVAIAVLLVLGLIRGAYLLNLKKTVKNWMNDGGTKALVLDEQGICLERGAGMTVRQSWDNIAFIRLFRESIVFFPKTTTSMILSVNRRYEDEALDWIRQNVPDLEIIR